MKTFREWVELQNETIWDYLAMKNDNPWWYLAPVGISLGIAGLGALGSLAGKGIGKVMDMLTNRKVHQEMMDEIKSDPVKFQRWTLGNRLRSAIRIDPTSEETQAILKEGWKDPVFKFVINRIFPKLKQDPEAVADDDLIWLQLGALDEKAIRQQTKLPPNHFA